MGLNVGSTPVNAVYVGSTPVTAVYVGAEKIWPTGPTVVQITLGTGNQARDQFRAALTSRGLDYTTITEIPFEIELVGSGSAQLMFYGCSALTTIPPLDTSGVTNMNGMFQLCNSLVTVPPLDTSNVTNAPSMFAYCRSLTSVPTMDAAKMTNVTNMFTGCTALTDGNVLLTNRNPAVISTNMISSSGLTREPWGTVPPPTAEVVQITLGADLEARDQFRAALAEWGLDYATVSEIPFDMELVGTGSARDLFQGCAALTSILPIDTSGVTNMRSMFNGCASLTTVPDMDTSAVTNMRAMLSGCSSLTYVPPMDTSQVTNMSAMFYGCSVLTHVPDLDAAQVTYTSTMFYNCTSLTDGNVRLIGRHPNVSTTDMITGSGLTREPFYTTDGQPWPTAEVHEVTLTNVTGMGTVHPLVSVTVPAGETWDVRIQGTITKASGGNAYWPFFRIGVTESKTYGQGAAVDFSGTVTSANSTIALVSNDFAGTSFTGTVTIEK